MRDGYLLRPKKHLSLSLIAAVVSSRTNDIYLLDVNYV